MIGLKTYEKRHNNKFPDNPIKVTEKIDNYIYFETEFGLCKKYISCIEIHKFSINDAINKTEYFINQANKIHNFKYDYSKMIYESKEIEITIFCKEHGEFKQKVRGHLLGHGCKKCSRQKIGLHNKSNLKDFIKKANLKHNYKYDYSLVNYTLSSNKINIICSIHGEFKQVANSHLLGYGCPKCGYKFVGEINSKNPTGWTLTNWKEKAKTSKNFDSFKVYILELFNEKEKFYKIGRTFHKIESRFKDLYYKYNIIEIFEGSAEEMFNLEIELKRLHKKHKYIPKIKFAGMQECFLDIY